MDLRTRAPRRQRNQIIRDVAAAEASPQVASLLELDEGDEVIVRRRTVLLDEEPVQMADSCYRRGDRVIVAQALVWPSRAEE